MNFKYPQEEKLKQKNDISLLFEKGKWQTFGKIRVISYSSEEITQHKLGVSVSKRYFKKAVDRNRAKRLLREVYRLHKTEFLEKFGSNSLSMIFYISQEKPKHFKEIEKDFLKLLKK
ncbi:ribonuclease P protein component [Cloacibacterium rupense]|uniref:ribonuclease P protein component n=1 Tax=Cloacibacterium rupense TaxID=517423 RepID=UPI001663C4D4|nr:ribonuclease P protein component [Cloacibacterium rupense]